ncbi:MAG: hypothetical protein FJY37_04460 [Betaproteobacteria bacterium]|nr:hypothetical protein [Betaproteobacteria bacterium]
MQVDALALELRPRPVYEAADLGVRLVQHSWRSLLRCHLPLMLLLSSLIGLLLWQWGLSWWYLLVWFSKPFIDRTVLFVLARAAFGQDSGWNDLWRARRGVWFGQPLNTFLIAHFSPWRSLTQPVLQLEGGSGPERQKRLAQFRRGRRGAGLLVTSAFAVMEWSLVLGLSSLVVWFAPPEHYDGAISFLGMSFRGTWLLAATYMLVVAFLEPFYVASGFGIYLNRRVELEAWDIEQELRRVFR